MPCVTRMAGHAKAAGPGRACVPGSHRRSSAQSRNNGSNNGSADTRRYPFVYFPPQTTRPIGAIPVASTNDFSSPPSPPPFQRPQIERFTHYMVRVSRYGPDRTSLRGNRERFGSEEKERFETDAELMQLITAWPGELALAVASCLFTSVRRPS